MIDHEDSASYEGFICTVWRPNGHRLTNHRIVLDGVFRIARTRAPWRDLPLGPLGPPRDLGGAVAEHLGHAERRRGRAGQTSDGRQLSDSSSASCGRLKGGSGSGPLPFEGWFSIRRHLRVDGTGLPTKTGITPGRGSDYTRTIWESPTTYRSPPFRLPKKL